MKLQVKTLGNQSVKEVDVPDEVFDYPYKEHLIHLAVTAVRSAARSGTAKVKGRGEVRGSGRKLFRQKGTGNARMGDNRSPIRKGGGTVHGPQPRDYTKKLSVREKKNAMKSALSQLVKEERLVVIDSLAIESHRTKDLAVQLDGLGATGRVILVDRWENDNLGLASRNLPKVKAVDALGLNVYDVVVGDMVLLSEDALGRIASTLGPKTEEAGS